MLDNDLKHKIQQAYRHFLERKGLQARYGQRVMIAEIAKALGAITQDADGVRQDPPAVVAIEAGTGTGKTLAYSLAAIALAQAAGKRVVIATATVALQEQLVHKDLPDIAENSGLSFDFVLAKGRGRYLCLAKLDLLLRSGQGTQSAAAFFAEEGFSIEVDAQSIGVFTQMMEALSGDQWDGDRDAWPEAIEDIHWSRVITDHNQCTNRQCAYFQQCAFFKARERLTQADVIVANHDLVLADLALGGGAILSDPADTLYVFDEAHHLPDKAIQHFAYSTRLRSTADWLGQIEKQLTRLLVQQPMHGDLRRLIEALPELVHGLRQQQLAVLAACEELADFSQHSPREAFQLPRHRFANGLVPATLRTQATALQSGCAEFAKLLKRLVELLKQAIEVDLGLGITSAQAEEWYPLFGSMLMRAEANRSLWGAFAHEDTPEQPPMARWLGLVETSTYFDIDVHVSPILAADTLRTRLWDAAYAVVLTSATLTALGGFERLYQRAGLPESSRVATVPSPFEYAQAALLQVPVWSGDPRDVATHTQNIITHLPELLEKALGALVLFASRKQMQAVFDGLAPAWQARILRQGVASKQEMLLQHRARIDQGLSSVLFGLASFTEGVDLPGRYCEHVVIAKIPFTVPDEPVDATLSEWIEAKGGNPFMEIAVPDASLKLTQACGRLLRTTQDRGVISVLDRRLVTQRYGRAILDALPPFRRLLE